MKNSTKKNILIAALALMAFSAIVDTAKTARADNPTTPTKVGVKKK
ncbi:hypothetical protein BH10PLA1_BH10PLA1_08270 [soil metagenome]